jgi:hypothetical protein
MDFENKKTCKAARPGCLTQPDALEDMWTRSSEPDPWAEFLNVPVGDEQGSSDRGNGSQRWGVVNWLCRARSHRSSRLVGAATVPSGSVRRRLAARGPLGILLTAAVARSLFGRRRFDPRAGRHGANEAAPPLGQTQKQAANNNQCSHAAVSHSVTVGILRLAVKRRQQRVASPLRSRDQVGAEKTSWRPRGRGSSLHAIK